MARTTDHPSTATRRTTATAVAQPDTNLSGSFDEQDRRDGDSQLANNTERRENLTAVRDAQDNERNDSREIREQRGNVNRRDDRELGESHDRDERKQDFRREQRSSPSAGMDAFAPMLEAWKQVFTSWSELAETMVKAQQDAFASMIGSANAHTEDISAGDRRNSEPTFPGSRTTASTPDRRDQDRR